MKHRKPCNGHHAAPTCEDAQCWRRDPLDPAIESDLITFRTPDGEAIYLDEIEAHNLGAKLIAAADQIAQEKPKQNR